MLALAPALLACAIVAPVFADDLTVGDPAPPLALGAWLKGEPIDTFEKGNVYVVEFWATWCGPCIGGMPHLSELQRRYEDEVTIIGVNIWEREPAAVPAWMEREGDALMDYAVAMQEGTRMAETWMEPAGERGIPASFIVDRDSTIAWIGHPGSLDEPLASVVAGTWDIEAARSERERERAIERERRAAEERFRERASDELAAYRDAGSQEERVDAVDAILALDPPQEVALRYFDQGFTGSAFGLQDPGRAIRFVRAHKDLLRDSGAGYLFRYASMMLDIDVFDGVRDLGLIVELAERAYELDNDDPAVSSLCARAHMERAVALQREAVKHASDAERAGMREALSRYESATGASD